MNEQLIKFIELCLMDGVVTHKEREVIFRKSKELGVPEDECEIILEGMIQQKGRVSEIKNEDSLQVSKIKFELKKPNIVEKKIINNQSKSLNINLKGFKIELNRLNEEENKLNEDWKPIEKKLKDMGSCKPSYSFKKSIQPLKEKREKLKKQKEQTLIEISNLKKSIFLENLLNQLPNQCYGSVDLYNNLNFKSKLFDSVQFNKLIRLLTHIENNEKIYSNLYDESISKYLENPNNRCFNLLLSLLNQITTHYSVLNVIIDNVDKDIVLFNKYFNLIEDEGIFLTKPEKKSLQTLKLIVNELDSINSSITKGISNLNRELNVINETLEMGFNNIQESLLGINESITESNNESLKLLKGIDENIDSMDGNIRQIYQSLDYGWFNF